jgi:hypothetical protein
MRLQVKKINILTDGEMIDATPFFHNQSRRKNPRQPYPASWMNLVSELFLKKRSSRRPWQQNADKHQEFCHICAPTLR